MSSDETDPCWHVFDGHYGSLPPGAPCGTDSDCTAPVGGTALCLFTSTSGSNKLCIWITYGKAGDGPCAFDELQGGILNDSGREIMPKAVMCRQIDQVFCNPSTGLCTPLGPPGAPCDNRGSDCASHSCDQTTCLATVAIGGACRVAECESGAYCDTPSSKCVSRFPPGSACTGDKQCTESACVGGVCSTLTPVQQNWLRGYGCILPRVF
jgi:hypothetical protein